MSVSAAQFASGRKAAARASGKPSRWHDTQGIMPKAALHPQKGV